MNRDEWHSYQINELATVKGGKRLKKGEKFSDKPTPFPYVRVSDFKNFSVDTSNLKYLTPESQSSISRYIINKEDIYISIAGTIGLVGTIPECLDGANLTENAARIILNCSEEIDRNFLVYYLASSKVQRSITARKSKNAQPKLALAHIKALEILLPPPIEQKKIAYVLSTVQRAIAQQEQLIQTTTELKKALMHKLFTEGLHGEKQKETAIGLVPESWEVVPIIKVCELMSGGTPSKQRADFWNGDIPWVSPKDMKSPRLRDSIDHISKAGLDAGSKLVPKNTLLIVIRGMILAKDIPVALTLRPMSFNQDMKAIVPRGDIEPDYLLYAMQFIKPYLRMHIGSSAHGTRTLLTSAIEQCLIPLPHKDVQKELSIAVKILETKISLHTKRQHALEELFQTLLHQLMTAQIRVHDIDLPGFEESVLAASSPLA